MMEEQPLEVKKSQAWQKNKNALIVVGRMGHGKSSFCKMIVNDSEKPKVNAKISIGSATLDCRTFKSSLYKDIFGQDIVIIDTPGLDSKSTVSLIAEGIDDLVLVHQINIVGIAYVLDIMQRDQDQLGGSYIFTFLDLLRVKYCYKINLTFCVLSKYDKNYQEEETMEELMKQFSEIFEMNKYGKMWERCIRWMSQPEKDKQVFKRKISKNLKEQFEEQTLKLNSFLKQSFQKKLCLSYQTYQTDRNQFDSIFTESLTQDYGKFQYQNETNQFELVINLTKKKGFLTKVACNILEFLFKGSMTRYLTYSFFMSPVLLPTLGIAGIQYLLSNYTGNVLPNIPEQQKQLILTRKKQQKLKMCLIKNAIEHGKLQGQQYTFNSLPYIVKIECFDDHDKTISVKEFIQNGKTTYKSTLCGGDNRIKLYYKLPAKEYYEKFLRQKSMQFYNKKQ